MKILDTITEKWNIAYAIIFVVATGFLVDIFEGASTVSLFIIALLTLAKPYIQRIVKYMDS